MLEIALIFHSTRSDNLGVGALTVSEIEIVRQVLAQLSVKANITVIDGKGPRDPYVSGPEVTVRDFRPLRRPQDFYRAIRKVDLVIDIGAGDSFADIYKTRRLFQLFTMKFLTHMAGRPLVLAPQTIGPFRSRFWRFLAAQTIRRSAIVATRDGLSTAAVREMGVSNDVIEASDVAMRLPYTPPPARTDGPVRVGLNVSGLLMNGGYSGKNMFGLKTDYRKLVFDIAEEFTRHRDQCELHLVPHVLSSVRGSVEDDYQASLDLAEKFPGIRVAPPFETPSEAKSYIAGMDFFMGARMHSCIAAFSSGVPVVPMAYSRKFAGLFDSLGYHHTVDCTSETSEAILEKILAAYEERDALAKEAREARDLALEKLARYERGLATLIERLAANKQARLGKAA